MMRWSIKHIFNVLVHPLVWSMTRTFFFFWGFAKIIPHLLSWHFSGRWCLLVPLPNIIVSFLCRLFYLPEVSWWVILESGNTSQLFCWKCREASLCCFTGRYCSTFSCCGTFNLWKKKLLQYDIISSLLVKLLVQGNIFQLLNIICKIPSPVTTEKLLIYGGLVCLQTILLIGQY